MEYIPVILSATAICVTLYLAFHKEHREEDVQGARAQRDISVQFTKLDVKQDAILQSVNDIRADMQTQNKRISDLEKQVVINEQSTKSAHKRIDDLLKGELSHES